MQPADLVKRGVIQVMEGRHCFAHLTVEENLLTGAYTRGVSRSEIKLELERVYEFFPRLKQRRTSLAGYTSGGEQQMTAIGRALMARPRMILLDEPSMGLAPQIVEEIFEIVGNLNKAEHVSFLLAEQNTMVALRFADFGYILENGRVVMEGNGECARRQRGREGVLPRHLDRRAPQLPRDQALSPAQAVAGVSPARTTTRSRRAIPPNASATSWRACRASSPTRPRQAPHYARTLAGVRLRQRREPRGACAPAGHAQGRPGENCSGRHCPSAA